MNVCEVVLIGAIVAMVIGALVLWGYEGNQCKMEAIKAGMKGSEIRSACM